MSVQSESVVLDSEYSHCHLLASDNDRATNCSMQKAMIKLHLPDKTPAVEMQDWARKHVHKAALSGQDLSQVMQGSSS